MISSSTAAAWAWAKAISCTFPLTFTRREIVEKVRFMKPATSFRSGYAYDNILYIVAGEVVAAVSGKSWESFVRERLLTPWA